MISLMKWFLQEEGHAKNFMLFRFDYHSMLEGTG